MSQKPKLIIGTANFSPKPYGNLTEPISLNMINSILDYARINGISIFEGAEDYNCDSVLGNQYFDLIYKVRHPYNLYRKMEKLGRTRLMGLLYHHGFDTQSEIITIPTYVDYVGASIYKAEQLSGFEQMVEVPLNLEQREFENEVYPCKIVRSVFGRGGLIQKHGLGACLKYVRDNPTVHGVIIGVDDIGQLKQILEEWNK